MERIRAILILLLAVGTASAQGQGSSIIYTRQMSFRIPFETDGADRSIRDVQLYVSEDHGQVWKKYGSASPDRRGFDFRAERDGLYWFATRIVDLEARPHPANIQDLRPDLRVFVDTQPPVVSLRQIAAQPGSVAIEWDIREDNLDLMSFNLEYRLPQSGEWLPLTAEPSASGQRSWGPGTNGVVEVRLRVRDLAKNEGEAKLSVRPGAGEYTSSTSADASRDDSATQPGKRWVNSRQISLNYEIKDQGPSGVSTVELWSTRDGRNWVKYKEDTEHKPPLVFSVEEEGVYGFTLLVKSGVGLGERPPKAADAPQVWVEVDLTKPIVHWINVDVGRGTESGNLTITWKASDKNLGRDPVTISYGADTQGPWTPIAKQIENQGRYVWHMPAGVPYKFWVKVEAKDKAGNVGSAQTMDAVIVDLHQPKGLITNIEAAGK
jgi:hypothetical protein